MINANGDPGRFAEFELPVVGDILGDFIGPLAGILTGMEWARLETPEAKWLASLQRMHVSTMRYGRSFWQQQNMNRQI